MGFLTRRLRDVLLGLGTVGNTVRLVYGLVPLMRGDRTIFDRARLHILLGWLAPLVRRRKLRGGILTETGEYYLAMPDGLLLYYNFSDPAFTRGDGQSLDFVGAPFAPMLEKLILAETERGAAYFDVGANNGYYYALRVARHRPDMKVYAFEPDPKILRHLGRNIAINKLPNVTIVPVALADREGAATMTANYGASNFLTARGGAGDEALIEVACDTLDAYVGRTGVPDPCLIKIDIEGGEFAFLKGAQDCIARSQPILVMELEDRWLRRAGASGEAVLGLLESWRYRCYGVNETTDVVCFPETKLDRLPPGAETWLTLLGRP